MSFIILSNTDFTCLRKTVRKRGKVEIFLNQTKETAFCGYSNMNVASASRTKFAAVRRAFQILAHTLTYTHTHTSTMVDMH